MSASRQRARWGLLAVALLAALLLVAASAASWRETHHVSDAVARGQAQLLLGALHQRLRAHPGPPSQAVLEELVAEQQEQGLRYAALVGARGEVVVAAGVPLAPVPERLQPHHVARVGAGVRAIGSLPLRGGLETRPPPRIVIDFDPRLGRTLVAHALRSFVVAVVAALLLVTAAAVFFRLSRRADAAEARLHHQRHLLAMGEMSAVLAHEIRNPLASLKGHAQLLEEQLPAHERPREKAARVVREAERLEVLVGSLLDFARAGRIERQAVPPARVLEAASEALDHARLAFDVAGAPASWSLDPLRIQQVLTNLLRNALQASPARVEVAVRLDDGGLVYLVRDHGEGIPAGDEERVFEAFYTTRTQGTGLGLSLARRVVELHGGRIAAENHPDGGAVFRVWLPAV